MKTSARLPEAEPTSPGPVASRGLLEGVGHTPLVELKFPDRLPRGVRLFAKYEVCNPGGSIKDRPVARMMTEAWRAGRFTGGVRLLDSSSGNAGISYAMLGASLGIPVTIVVPGNASAERLERIRAYGAELILTDPLEGYDFAVLEAQRLAREQPERYWYCDQYSNPANWWAHYHTTGEEILQQVEAQAGMGPDVLVAGVGTGGTITGVGRRLRESNPDLRVVAAIPERFPGIEGLKPLGAEGDIVPAILDETLLDARVDVSSEAAGAMCAALSRQGLFVGPSSGAFVHVALEMAERGAGECIVTFLCDTGERYGSTGLWRNHG